MTKIEPAEIRTDSFKEDVEETRSSHKRELKRIDVSIQDYTKIVHERFLFEREETSLIEESNEINTDLERDYNYFQGQNLRLFKAVQKWKGFITEIKDEGFSARLKDLTEGGTDEEAWFSFNEISDKEQNELKLGKAFYLSLGYSEYLGQVEKVMRLHFQKVTNWELGLIDEVNDKVKEYIDLLDD